MREGSDFKEPDVCRGARQFDMTHAITADLGQGDFNATLLTDHTTVLEALVLAAQALIVFGRPEDARTEQTVALRLERTIVNGLRLFDFTERPRADHFRRCQTDSQRVEFINTALSFQQIK